MKYIVAVDIGTSSTKAIAFDLFGKSLVEYRVTYPIISSGPTYCEQEPECLFDAVVTCITQVCLLMKQRFSVTSLLGVSFSSAMHGLIVVDQKGTPLTNCIIWADTRSEPFAADLKASSIGHDIYMNTGTPIHAMSPLCKIGWMQVHMKDTFDSAHKFISIKEYVFFKLFGQYVIDFSIASATGLLETRTQRWYAPALEVAGISPEQLSTLVPITHILHGLVPYYADLMQIDDNVPFIVGGSDGCLANLGAGAVTAGLASVTIGTSGAIRLVSEEPSTDPKGRIFSYVISPEIFVLGGAVNNGGNILQWFQNGFISDNEQPLNITIPLLTAEASTISAGSEGLIFLPYLAGERAPYWDAKAKGVFFGIQMHHRKAHFIRAIMEGIIFGMYSIGKALEETVGAIDLLLASGGFARSGVWIQMLSDIFNKKVCVKRTVESSAMGAAIVGMEALRLIDGFKLWDESDFPIAEFYPDQDRHRIYMENFIVFERLYIKLKDEF
ncbi:gluconokinase [Olivibacter sp. SDN3]|uniref:gluconokinase n=1 Tax=Olivibacter sp. SDN3 TaxID=2764720 RepID=UPI0016513A8E|nr:gluconokinase [Olivibacter sp. SDN3]QNL48340.1 gluconokinase [Olivibacter sp. SDN3]